MYLNKLYRSDRYCEIPKCDSMNLPYGYYCGHYFPPDSNQLINCNSDEKLSCGCLPFEYRSHNSSCKLFNSNEDQPYYPGCLS